MSNTLYKKIATDCVQEAGKLLMDNLEKIKRMSFKAKSDIVTDIDLVSEKMIIQKIKENSPDHSILSEEAGLKTKKSKYMWIIDPIDGTINYYHGCAPFRVSVCLLEEQEPILAAIYNPIKDELYLAEKEKGATLNGSEIKVNSNSDIENSVVMTHISSKREARMKVISSMDRIFGKVLHMRAFGCCLAAMTYIASGKFDVFFNVNDSPWEILPAALLIQEAGGVVTDIQGNPVTTETRSVLATNGSVHNDMLELLKDI